MSLAALTVLTYASIRIHVSQENKVKLIMKATVAQRVASAHSMESLRRYATTPASVPLYYPASSACRHGAAWATQSSTA